VPQRSNFKPVYRPKHTFGYVKRLIMMRLLSLNHQFTLRNKPNPNQKNKWKTK
jgi:hypothetical protein